MIFFKLSFGPREITFRQKPISILYTRTYMAFLLTRGIKDADDSC